ncbi:MAG: hypothetical protein ACT4OO_03930 [Nitrospiraceae bacterium]
MNVGRAKQALYYPFHLCHARTLEHLLQCFAVIHFRDSMALQLTPMAGVMAYEDRMGSAFPELVESGRIIQGHVVSGPLDDVMVGAVDRDLADEVWRTIFHRALKQDRRFQHGLFDLSHAAQIGRTTVPGPAALLILSDESYGRRPYNVQQLKDPMTHIGSSDQDYDYEYGFALIKTSASLAYTVRLARRHDLIAVTDSEPHFQLLERSLIRDDEHLMNERILREGY